VGTIRDFLLTVLAALAFAPSSLHADELNQVIVTATRSTRMLSHVPESASVVTAARVQDTPAQSLDDVLRHVPGVNLPLLSGIEAHPTADNVSMRGLGGIHALVLLDGVPLNDPFFGSIQWGRIPMEEVDHIEIVRGGGSPLWGNYAMGGVINIITRPPDDDTAIAEVAGGSFGTYRSSLYGSYGLAAGNRVSVSALFNGTGGFQQVPDYARSDFDTTTSFRARNFDIRDRWQATDGLTVGARFDYHRNDQRLGTSIETNHQDIPSFVLDARQSFSEDASLAVTAFYLESTFVSDDPTVNDSTLPPSEQTEHLDSIHTTPYHNLGGSLVWSQEFHGFLGPLTAGFDASDVKGSDRAAIFDSTGAMQIRTDFGRGEQLLVGGFVQQSILPLEHLEMLASGRVQYFEVLDGYNGDPGGPGPEPNQSIMKVDPRVSVRYALTDWMALRAAYYEAFRAPTLDELYRGFASDGGIYYPNSDLKPETLSGGEVGVDFTGKGLRTELTYYYTHVNDLITTATLPYSDLPPGFFFGTIQVNAVSALAQGIEAEVDWRIAGGLAATLGYTWAESIYRSNPDDPLSVGQQLVDVPRNLGSAAISYEDPGGWRISSDGRYVSATEWANPDHTNPGFPYQASADSHFVLDLAATYPINQSLEAFVQIQNLLDRHYIANPGPYNPPQYGTPFEALVGTRLTWK
jgi:outer membrane receptor protein involved in Fe transport